MDYDTFRHFADSWFLIAMTGFFVGVSLWTFRPGAARLHRDLAELPLKEREDGDDQA